MSLPSEILTEAGREPPEGGHSGLQPEAVDDRLVRAVGIPGFALAISHWAGLYRPYRPGQWAYWMGLLWFVLLSALIWHANRWLLFKQREYVDWFGHRVAKIVLLLTGVVLGTLPITIAMLLVWYALAGLAPDRDAIRTVALTNVICVLFVTHVYETVFLIKGRVSDRVRLERLTRARAEAELAALKAQVDPHFLFNSLNTLTYLIEDDPARARQFGDALARVYRYILASQHRHLVLLSEEMAFFEDYAGLLRLRFGAGIEIARETSGAPLDRRLLPPISLQVLLENAVKHNEVSGEHPLAVRLEVHDGFVVVANRRRPRLDASAGAGVGLRNLRERYRLATSRDVDVREDAATFEVRLPLLEA